MRGFTQKYSPQCQGTRADKRGGATTTLETIVFGPLSQVGWRHLDYTAYYLPTASSTWLPFEEHSSIREVT